MLRQSPERFSSRCRADLQVRVPGTPETNTTFERKARRARREILEDSVHSPQSQRSTRERRRQFPRRDGSALAHQLFELEHMPDRMHARVLEHRVDAVPRLPLGLVLRRLEPILAQGPRTKESRSAIVRSVGVRVSTVVRNGTVIALLLIAAQARAQPEDRAGLGPDPGRGGGLRGDEQRPCRRPASARARRPALIGDT